MSRTTNQIENLRKIFLKGVESVQPSSLFLNNKKVIQEIETAKVNNCHVVGFGKAVLGMAVQLERILDKSLISGIISVPIGTKDKFSTMPDMTLSSNTVIKIYEGAENNLPDEKSVEAAKQIKILASSMQSNDTLFVLISGGGSALLPLPKPPITLEKKLEIIRSLTGKGIGIEELNIVRIAMSETKGGKLLESAKNGRKLISLIISDIINDPVEFIASGPTVPFDSKNKKSAKEILKQYEIWNQLENSIQFAIEQESKLEIDENKHSLTIIGNNKVAAEACLCTAKELGYNSFILSTTIDGNIEKIAAMYVKFLKNLKKYRNGSLSKDEFSINYPFNKKCFDSFINSIDNTKESLLLILSGEPTVIIKGFGKGGRNQELALQMSLNFYENKDLNDIVFLSAGTDGIDGPTIAAGAIGLVNVVDEYLEDNKNFDISELKKYLNQNDSFTFYDQLKNGKFHIITGHTGTNVMDLHLILVP